MTVFAPDRRVATATLRADTTPLADTGSLIPLTDARDPMLWMRKGQGIAGIGTALRLEFSGPTRMTDAAAAWREIVSRATITDPVSVPGSGLVAFGTFAFSDTSAATSVLIVPQLIVGRRDGTSWVTRVTIDGAASVATLPKPTALGDEYRIRLVPGALDPNGFLAAVVSALGDIREHGLDKVVLARDLVGHLPNGADLRRLLSEIAVGYRDCWSYAVDGMIGASPETLVRVDRGSVDARVLAGTISRGRDAAGDHDAAIMLAASGKDQREHAFALNSVREALRPHTASLRSSEIPFTVKLPNLWHLATDLDGTLNDGSTSLDLIGALHPTAAVAGTPTAEALAVIERLEPFDRGRYAGPIGWVDADGDGEWALALRGAQVAHNGDITAYAGCGIVADSDPERELAETRLKFRPITEAFG